MKKGLVLGAVLVAVLLASLVGYAAADSQTYSSPASGTVTATATVNPKITLTLNTPDASQTVNFGAVDPGIAVAITKVVNVTVQSNKPYALAVSKAGAITTNPDLQFSTSLAAFGTAPKPGATYNDTYSLQPTWNAAPADYSGTVQYTVTQN